MFTREVNRPLPYTFVASKVRVLSNQPARIATQEIGIARWIAQRCCAGIVYTDTGEDVFQLLDAMLRIALVIHRVSGGCIGRWRCICCPSMAACIINEQSACTRLTGRRIPERLDIQVCEDEAVIDTRPGAILIPVGRIELQKELGDGSVAELRDGGVL